MDANNPQHVADNMVIVRGKQGALDRLDRYISGAIRSEQPKSFWQAVKDTVK